MKVQLEMYEAVWERTWTEVEIPDGELAEYGDDPREAVTDWVYDNFSTWQEDAYHEIDGTVDSVDYSLSITPIGKDGWVSS